MRTMPNDTLILTFPDFSQTATIVGDPNFPIDGWGGNDTVTATILNADVFVTLIGEDTVMQGNSHGGNDTLTANVDYPFSGATIMGDAETMLGNAAGGNDTLSADAGGNFRSNISIYGDAGGDMSGSTQGGNDTLTAVTGGRAFENVFSGDAGGSMSDNAHGGNDTLNVFEYAFESTATLSGDAVGAMTGNAIGGSDNLTLGISSDMAIGGGSLAGDSLTSLDDNAQGGNDTLSFVTNGGEQPPAVYGSQLVGDAPNMSGNARGGNDTLNGGEFTDHLYGDARTYAPSTPGSITGGTDTLNGGAGNDQLWGGPNNDVFVFTASSGNDVINDFNQGNTAVGSTAPELDVINLHDYGFADWAAVSSLISDDSSGNAVIHLSANDTITLSGVHAASLEATDFII
jgi:hypothetical protein